MLQPADVLNLKCKFVYEVINSIKLAKTSVKIDMSKSLKTYANFMLSFYLKDCLEYEDECNLLNQRFSSIPSCANTTTACVDQDVITLSSALTSCNTYYKTKNIYDNSTFPTVSLLDNSFYHPSYIKLVTYAGDNSCVQPIQEFTVESGCQFPSGTCSSSQFNFAAVSVVQLIGTQSLTLDSHITNIRLYVTDSAGQNPTPLNVDISLPNVSTWTACPSCLPVTLTDLYLSSPNFEFAFPNLISNVSRTLYGSDATSLYVTNLSGAGWFIQSRIKHNPSTRYIGFHTPDFQLKYFDAGTDLVTTVNNIGISQQGTYFFDTLNVQTPCGTTEVIVKNNSLGPDFPINSFASTFNKIVLYSNNSTTPISVSGSISCDSTLLSASYYTTSPILEWTDSTDTVVSTTNTAVVTDPASKYFS